VAASGPGPVVQGRKNPTSASGPAPSRKRLTRRRQRAEVLVLDGEDAGETGDTTFINDIDNKP
jgi:hypothetical protein